MMNRPVGQAECLDRMNGLHGNSKIGPLRDELAVALEEQEDVKSTVADEEEHGHGREREGHIEGSEESQESGTSTSGAIAARRDYEADEEEDIQSPAKDVLSTGCPQGTGCMKEFLIQTSENGHSHGPHSPEESSQEYRNGGHSQVAKPLQNGSHVAEDQGQSWGAVTLTDEVDSLLTSQPALRLSGTRDLHRVTFGSSSHANLSHEDCASGGKDSRKIPAAPPQSSPAPVVRSSEKGSSARSEPSGPMHQAPLRCSPAAGAQSGTSGGQHSPCDDGRLSAAPAGSAAPRMTSTVAILRHSAAVCSALGRAASRITAQAGLDSKGDLAAFNADEMLEMLERSLEEEQCADPVLNSLLAAPMLSAFIHAFRSEACSTWGGRGRAFQGGAAALGSNADQREHTVPAEPSRRTTGSQGGASCGESTKQRLDGQAVASPAHGEAVPVGPVPATAGDGPGSGAGAGYGAYDAQADSEVGPEEAEEGHLGQWRIQRHTGKESMLRHRKPGREGTQRKTNGEGGTLRAPGASSREDHQRTSSARGGRVAPEPSVRASDRRDGGRKQQAEEESERGFGVASVARAEDESGRAFGFAARAQAQEESAGNRGTLSGLQQILLATNPLAAIALDPLLRAPEGSEEGAVHATKLSRESPGVDSDGEGNGGRSSRESAMGSGGGYCGVDEETWEEEVEERGKKKEEEEGEEEEAGEGEEEGVVHIRRLEMRGRRGKHTHSPGLDHTQIPGLSLLGLGVQGEGGMGALVHSSLGGPGPMHNALGAHSGAGGSASAALMLAARAVAAMEQHNRLTAASLAQGHAAAQLQAQQLQVSLESTDLMRTEVQLAKEKQVSRAARDKEARAEKELERFLRQLADELLFGLLVMLLGLLYAGWNTAGVRLEAEAVACLRLQEDAYTVSWFSAYRVDRAVMKALRFLGCKLSVGLQLFMAFGIVGAICYFLIITNVLGSQASRPASVILFTLAGVCGYCGFQAVQYAGGNALLWLLLWELLCAIHTAACFYAPAVFLLLHARLPGGVPQATLLDPDATATAGAGGGDSDKHSSCQSGSDSDGDSESEFYSDFDSDSVAARGLRNARRLLKKWAHVGLQEAQAQVSRLGIPPWLRSTAFHLSISLVLPLCTALLPFHTLPRVGWSTGPYWL